MSTEMTSAAPAPVYKCELSLSTLKERSLGLAIAWGAFAPRLVTISHDGVMSHIKSEKLKEASSSKSSKNGTQYLLEKIELSMLAADVEDAEQPPSEVGIIVKCQTLDRVESYFRVIVSNSELAPFLAALKKVAKEHNIDTLRCSELQVKKPLASPLSFLSLRSKQSVMRRAVSVAMNSHDRRSKRDLILAKRGAFKWLPVKMSNDLIHGSWWFAVASVGVVITCVLVIWNKYSIIFEDDDSVLADQAFVASWVLMLLSGIFSTLGSLAFVRAFHEDPPMRPLFSTYHLQSDELMASWLFFLATIPFVPYTLLFLASDDYQSLLFLAALGFALVASAGALLFVRACYPSDRSHKDILPILVPYFCCCMSTSTREFYFLNDWLGGSWFFFWGSAFVTFASLCIFLYDISIGDQLQMWIMGTSLFECLFFLIGSAYFVAGSYPDESADKVSSHGPSPSTKESAANGTDSITVPNPIYPTSPHTLSKSLL